ncbi:hypothetical protein L1049_001269 [Liquidambar formosana]|uniref:STAS domain-containing protein n=1 Tax=Liquidambar formosana TaxID=63359 RepID=A0AAP0NED7_LIQFO
MGASSKRVEDSSDISGDETTVTVSTDTRPPLEIHRVCLPPQCTTFQKLRDRVAEIFFPDDPLYKFKNQTLCKKLVLGVQYFFPVFQWLPDYSISLFRSDLISGLTIASLAIPQGISYARLAQLPPIIGLYSSFVPPLLYSVLGSSRHLGIGPVSIASLVMGTMLGEMVSSVDEPILHLKLAFTATFFAGVFQASLGLFRLGFIIDFLSKPTLVGFMAGAAIIVSMQQLKALFGIKHFTSKMQIIPVMSSVFKQTKEIGRLPKGLNPTSANMLNFHGPYLGLAIKTGIVTGILSLTEGLAVGRTFASMQNYRVDGNKEMTAIGLMNMAGSCASCYITTGSFSRSAVNYNAGAKTALSNVVMAAAVLVGVSVSKILLQVTRPNTLVLGNILGTQIYQSFVRYENALRVPSFLILGVEAPIYFANSTYLQERFAVLFNSIEIFSYAVFLNSIELFYRIVRWVREEEERIQEGKETTLKCVVLDMSAVTAIDTSGIDAIHELRKTLDKRILQLVLVNPVGNVIEKLHHSRILESFRSSGLYLTVGEAVADISSSWKALP